MPIERDKIVEATIDSVEEEKGLYKATLRLRYHGKTFMITISKLERRPGSLVTSIHGDYILIELFDEKGGALATCCIHKGHLEKGCISCPSLLCPPSK